jgi:hypothetical protein
MLLNCSAPAFVSTPLERVLAMVTVESTWIVALAYALNIARIHMRKKERAYARLT